MNCKYCNLPENKQDRPGLACEICKKFVHLNCLRRPGTPGDLSCDVFFSFICEDCSPNKKEIFKRTKFHWVNVIILTLHNLSIKSYGISNHGFFHYKMHICSFIDRNWKQLLGSHIKQKKNWIGTISGAMSQYNNILFQSGSQVLGEAGWWRLMHKFSPSVALHILQAQAHDKSKGRSRNTFHMDKNSFVPKAIEMGYKDLLIDEPEFALFWSLGIDPVPLKKRKIESDADEIEYVADSSLNDVFDSDSSRNQFTIKREAQEDTMVTFPSDLSFLENENSLPVSNEYVESKQILNSDSSSVNSLQQSFPNYDSDSQSRSSYYMNQEPSDETDFDTRLEENKQEKIVNKEKLVIIKPKESFFSSRIDSANLPWIEHEQNVNERTSEKLSEYEEVQLLKQVESIIPKVKDINKQAHLRRFRMKLSLRRLKRHKHLPLFDLDKTVKRLGGFETEDPKTVTTDRVLDRFQISYLIDNLCGTIVCPTYGTLILGHIEPTSFQSPYSGVYLKPFIRRDRESTPLWLRVTDELLRKVNKKVKGYEPPRRESIDYSYVRPQHIAAVNNLCSQFFWPGVDLTEALQYPEFSCVVTYKKLVVGFAFLVPDAGPNEAYITFILTRPEWRNSKIATFMLYHLLQTCTGRDVTLHVSPTNSAVFLYQKFGFKVEELIQDFYEKYYEINSKDCKHALLLRLSR